MADLHLSDAESRVLNKLEGSGDVKISVLFRVLRGRWPEPTESPRWQQQQLGSLISRINKKIGAHGHSVVPGARRRTYRLSRISK